VTHNPPFGILDLGLNGSSTLEDEVFCFECGEIHKGHSHYGCPEIKRHIIDRIRYAVLIMKYVYCIDNDKAIV